MIHHLEDRRAEFYIAQYMEDVFRREVRNVGVFVRVGDRTAARFLGENENGDLDGRRLKVFVAPDVYRQWVEYWRRVLETETAPLDVIKSESKGNFFVVDGGEVRDVADDPAESILAFLYTSLVAEGGFGNAYADREALSIAGSASPRLTNEVQVAFQHLNILDSQNQGIGLVSHPIQTRPQLQGTVKEPHRPQFAQENGRLFVMETIDFTDRSKERARDHAGFTSFMFNDLRSAISDKVSPIAVVRYSPSELDQSDVRYGLSMLENTADQVVNWNDAEARSNFVEERRRIALSGGGGGGSLLRLPPQ
jgi:hypothetical protein